MDETRLLEIAQDWAIATLDAWRDECISWDMLIEHGDITEEELGWIRNNVSFSVGVEKQ